MSTTDQQIAELRNRIAALEEENKALRAPARARAPNDPPREMITTTGDRAPQWMLPGSDELSGLKEIIFNTYPDLHPKRGRFFENNMAEFDRGFEVAMQWLAVKGRGPLDNKRAFSWWCDDVSAWAHSTNLLRNSTIDDGVFAAMLAWGDVDFALPFGSQIGLAAYGWREPKEPTWRNVLATQRLKAPIAPIQVRKPPQTIRIDGVVDRFLPTW